MLGRALLVGSELLAVGGCAVSGELGVAKEYLLEPNGDA